VGRSGKGRVAALGIPVLPKGVPVPSLTHDGLERKYVLYRPDARAGDEPRPLLIALHGGRTNGRQYFGEDVVGRTSRALDACGVIWEFFEGHVRG